MNNEDNKDIDRYQRRKSVLRQFYAADPDELTPEEQEWSNPILKALKSSEERYQELEPIASGGEKQIIRTFDQRLKRCVAMAYPIETKTPDDLEQFLREAQLTANLMHPNIVPVYNMGIGKSDTPFFTMELLPGDSLKDIIEKLKSGDAAYKTQYPLETLLGIYNKVCDAVAYAHSREVLHLDIKPDNIRVGQFGEVLLCDWGLAHVGLNEETHTNVEYRGLDGEVLNDMTLSGTLKGTPGFMAPEQASDGTLSSQTDIYALGAILYMILTNKLPVDGDSANEVIENTRNGKVIHPRNRHSGRPVSSSLAAVTMKALSTKPENRYRSVQKLQNDVNRFLASYPTDAEHAGIFTRLILLNQRHRKVTFWIMAFLVVLTLVVSVNLTIINHQKQIAEKNFALYKKEHQESIRISEELATLSYHTQGVRDYISAGSMIPVTEQLLAQADITPKIRQEILLQKAQMHLMLQQFNAAYNALEQLQNPGKMQQDWMELCQQYSAIKPNDYTSLRAGDLARLLNNSEIINRDMSLFMYFHHGKQTSRIVPEEHIKLAAVMLSRLNELNEPEIPSLKLSKRPQGYHLDLSHTPYSQLLITIPLVYRQNVLMPLKLYSLDISHTPISLTRDLKRMNTRELRMVGVLLKPLNTLPWTLQGMKLERVTLGKGDYSEEIIQKIRYKGIEVIEEEYER